MWRYVTEFLLLIIIGYAPLINAGVDSGTADNWILESSEESSWIETVNAEQQTLLFSYHENRSQFLLILKTNGLKLEKTLSATIRIDHSPKQSVHLNLVEEFPEQSVMRIEMDEGEKSAYLSQMINGLAMSIYIDFPSEKMTAITKNILFSLKGFTVALNDLLIVNDIGSLNQVWLLQHNKDRELYCLLTTDITIDVMQYRLSGESFNNVLHLIPETGHSIIDHNLGEIIEQVYNIPYEKIVSVPRAEKYLMFSNCMAQPI